MYILITSSICGVVMLLLSYTVFILYVRRKYTDLPGPPPSSFYLGHLPILKSLKEKKIFHHNLFLEWAKCYGPAYKIFFFHKCLIVVTGPEIIKELLTRSKYLKAKMVYSRLYSVCGARFLGNGFVTNLNHREWSKRRACVNPAFRKKYLQNSMSTFNEVADRWIQRLYHMADGKTCIEMADMFGRVTLDMIGKIGFNMEIGSIENQRNPFPSSLLTAVHGMAAAVRDPLYRYRSGNWSAVKEIHRAVEYIREECRQQILHRLNSSRNGQHFVHTDIVSCILKEKEILPHLNIEDFVDDFVTVVVAGQETTANALSFMLGEIGRNPHVLNRLLLEVNKVIGKEAHITYEHIGRLEYMDQVWKETLRLYPVAPATVRETHKETTIDGITFPANSTVIIPFYVIHRMPQYFENSLEFNPDRFSPEKSRKLFTYMPFSSGQRSCAGQQFAQIEAKILLCKFLQNFVFTLDPNQSFDVYETTTLRPRGGTQMTIVKR